MRLGKRERNIEQRQDRRKEMRVEEIEKWRYIMQLNEVSEAKNELKMQRIEDQKSGQRENKRTMKIEQRYLLGYTMIVISIFLFVGYLVIKQIPYINWKKYVFINTKYIIHYKIKIYNYLNKPDFSDI